VKDQLPGSKANNAVLFVLNIYRRRTHGQSAVPGQLSLYYMIVSG
jgi:hypothetical protein